MPRDSSDFDARVDRILAELVTVLLANRWKLATAESCTGGWIAKCCTDVPGSSEWFERGYVTYSNQAKSEMLGVTRQALCTEGAVSRMVAEQMARGAMEAAGVAAALAVTGIAGPDGGTPDKPVGTVWFAWCTADRGVASQVCRFDGDRTAVRQGSVIRALDGLLTQLG